MVNVFPTNTFFSTRFNVKIKRKKNGKKSSFIADEKVYTDRYGYKIFFIGLPYVYKYYSHSISSIQKIY